MRLKSRCWPSILIWSVLSRLSDPGGLELSRRPAPKYAYSYRIVRQIRLGVMGRHKDDVEVVNSPYHTGRLCKPCYGPIACVHLSKLDCSEAALAAVEQANADVAPRRPLSQCKALVGMRFQHLGRWVFQQRWLSVGAHQPTSSSQSWPATAHRLLTSATLVQSWKACPCP